METSVRLAEHFRWLKCFWWRHPLKGEAGNRDGIMPNANCEARRQNLFKTAVNVTQNSREMLRREATNTAVVGVSAGNYFRGANSALCQLLWKEVFDHRKEWKGIVPFLVCIVENSKRNNEQIKWRRKSRKKRGNFVLNEEQWEWEDRDDEEPLSWTCTPGMFLKGNPLRLLAICVKGRDVLASSSGCHAVFLHCPFRDGARVIRGRATVWASHLQLINSHTLILTADHN